MTGYRQIRFIDELQADMDEYIHEAEMIVQALRDAESCETKEDFIANLESAHNMMLPLRGDLKAILGIAQRCKRYSEDRRN